MLGPRGVMGLHSPVTMRHISHLPTAFSWLRPISLYPMPFAVMYP